MVGVYNKFILSFYIYIYVSAVNNSIVALGNNGTSAFVFASDICEANRSICMKVV